MTPSRSLVALEVLGTVLRELPSEAQIPFRRRNIGFVFQQFNLLPALTAAENVAVPLFVAGAERRGAVQRARALLSDLGLGERADALPSELSGGQQQRVALARAVIHEPRLIVCKSGLKVMELLAAVAVRSDRAVIVVTHDSRVFKFADRIAHMEDGRITHIESLSREARLSAPHQAAIAQMRSET